MEKKINCLCFYILDLNWNNTWILKNSVFKVIIILNFFLRDYLPRDTKYA